ncbi:MAG: SdrD B-like domain [Pseudonocardiales bacterium]|nr:SdrD B-like domain [Pseudonocardiales bacterium]
MVNAAAGTTAGLQGVRAVLVNPTTCPVRTHAFTTGAAGLFTFTGVPAGSWYKLYFFTPVGWTIRYANSNPVSTAVVGRETARMGVQVVRGTARPPTLPTKCS